MEPLTFSQLNVDLFNIITKYEMCNDPCSKKIHVWWLQLEEFNNKPLTPVVQQELKLRVKILKDEILADIKTEEHQFASDLQDWIRIIESKEALTSSEDSLSASSAAALKCIMKLKTKTSAVEKQNQEAEDFDSVRKILRNKAQEYIEKRAQKTEKKLEKDKEKTEKDLGDMKEDHSKNTADTKAKIGNQQKQNDDNKTKITSLENEQKDNRDQINLLTKKNKGLRERIDWLEKNPSKKIIPNPVCSIM